MIQLTENSITIVIVIYNINIEDCLTYKTLVKYIHKFKLAYDIIVFNNSSNVIIQQNEGFDIVNSSENKKLCGAYNYALNKARKNNCKWLLLMDQDTELTADYFVKLNLYFENCIHNSEIASIVPYLEENNKIISPHKIGFVKFKNNKKLDSGIHREHITAFNSLSLLNVEFMVSIGGFGNEYPLDMLDHWYYLQIYKFKKAVYVLDTKVKHELSINDYEKNVSYTRHLDILQAEKKFSKEQGQNYYFAYKIRLTYRLIKQFIFYKDKLYAKTILKTLLNKL